MGTLGLVIISVVVVLGGYFLMTQIRLPRRTVKHDILKARRHIDKVLADAESRMEEIARPEDIGPRWIKSSTTSWRRIL
jgi:hypothetical protein